MSHLSWIFTAGSRSSDHLAVFHVTCENYFLMILHYSLSAVIIRCHPCAE